MWNLGIPFKRLSAGFLSYLWIFQLLLFLQNDTVENSLVELLRYKEYFLPFVFLLIILSYPLGEVIQQISYLFGDRILYRFFILEKNGYDRSKHRDQLRELNLVCSDRTYNNNELKEQELSILGSCVINFLLLSIVLLYEYKLELFVAFSFLSTFVFSVMVIHKYKKYIKYIERIYEHVICERQKKQS